MHEYDVIVSWLVHGAGDPTVTRVRAHTAADAIVQVCPEYASQMTQTQLAGQKAVSVVPVEE